jgi:hypothetical protein
MAAERIVIVRAKLGSQPNMLAKRHRQVRSACGASISPKLLALIVIVLGLGFVDQGCHSQKNIATPSIEFTHIPPAGKVGTHWSGCEARHSAVNVGIENPVAENRQESFQDFHAIVKECPTCFSLSVMRHESTTTDKLKHVGHRGCTMPAAVLFWINQNQSWVTP